MNEIINANTDLLPDGYAEWRKDIEHLIEVAKLRTAINVNADTLALYWTLGKRILAQQRQLGWGANIISKLSVDLSQKFPNDRGYSLSNLKSMRRFAEAYPDFPFLQVPLAKMENIPIGQVALDQFKEDDKGFVQVELAQITWYHHISLLSKVKDIAERAYYITETAQNGWSRDVMLMQIANGYIHAKGHAINNFEQTLPPLQSDLAKYIFKDPYNFSFLGTVALQNELDIEKTLTSKITDFLLEMGRGFAYIGRQYHISVDGVMAYAGFLIKYQLDEHKVNPIYLRYFTLSTFYKQWVANLSVGSTHGNISAQTFADCPIVLPPRHQQDVLVETLSNIDAKIKLNRQINDNLPARTDIPILNLQNLHYTANTIKISITFS